MKATNLSEKIVKIAKIALYLIAGSFLLWLSLEALVNGNKWRTLGEGVGITLLRILVLIATVLLAVWVGGFFDRLLEKYKNAEWILLASVGFLFALCNIWWVSMVPYVIDGDQAIIWQNAVLNIQSVL